MRRLTRVALLLVASLAGVPSHAVERTGEIQTDYPDDGVRIGTGWSRLHDGKTSGQCIEFKLDEDHGQSTASYVLRVHEKDQLSRNLSVSVRARAKGIAGNGSVSGRASLVRDLTLTSENLNLSVRARVDNGAQFAIPRDDVGEIVLKERFADLARTDLERFLKVCGDSYVSSIYSGGTIDGVLSFSASTREEKESIERHVKANIGNVSASASMTSFLRSYREAQRLSIFMVSFGGSGQPLGVDEATLLSAVHGLSAAVAAPGAAKKFRIGVRSYDQLSNWPREVLSSPQGDRLHTLVSQYLRFQTVYDDMAAILRQPALYVFTGEVSEASVRSLQDSVQEFLGKLRREIDVCVRDATCPEVDSSSIGPISKEQEAATEELARVEQESAEALAQLVARFYSDSLDRERDATVAEVVPMLSIGSIDYEIRERLPPLRRDIAELAERDAIEVRLVQIENGLQNTPKCILRDLKSGGVRNPEYIRLVDERESLYDRRNAIDQMLPFRAGTAAYEAWVYGVADQRCSEDPVAPLCLSQEDRRAIRERMLGRFAEPVQLINRLRLPITCP